MATFTPRFLFLLLELFYVKNKITWEQCITYRVTSENVQQLPVKAALFSHFFRMSADGQKTSRALMKPLMSADALLKVNRRPGVKTKTIMHHHQETCISVYSLLHFFHSLSLDLDHDPYKCFKTFIDARLNYSSGTAVRPGFSNLPSPSSPSHQLQSCISAHFHLGFLIMCCPWSGGHDFQPELEKLYQSVSLPHGKGQGGSHE